MREKNYRTDTGCARCSIKFGNVRLAQRAERKWVEAQGLLSESMAYSNLLMFGLEESWRERCFDTEQFLTCIVNDRDRVGTLTVEVR